MSESTNKNIKPKEVVFYLVVAMLGIWWLASGSNGSNAPVKKEKTDSVPNISPEEIVKMRPNSFACVSKDDLMEVVGHAIAHEVTKADAMFADFRCSPIPVTETYKVIHVESGIIEFVNTKSASAEGMWTIIESASK